MDRSLPVTDGLDWSTFFSLPNYYSYFGSSFIAVQFGSFSALPCLKGETVRPGRPHQHAACFRVRFGNKIKADLL
jgi:hypothetical protein